MTERPGRDRDDGDVGGRPAARPVLSRRQVQLVDLILVLGAIALTIVVTGMVGKIFFDFGDVILTFFLAWLIAFILSPLVRWMIRTIPGLPRAVAAAIVYVLLLAVVIGAIVFLAGTLARSVADFIAFVPRLIEDLPSILKPLEDWLQTLGFTRSTSSSRPAGPRLPARLRVGDRRAAPVDRGRQPERDGHGPHRRHPVGLHRHRPGRIRSFVNRLVPPGRREEFALLETSVSRSFGGFLRGQAVIGLAYALVAFGASAILGLPLIGVTTAAAGTSWRSLLRSVRVLGAARRSWPSSPTRTDPADPGDHGIGWFVVMNILQPG